MSRVLTIVKNVPAALVALAVVLFGAFTGHYLLRSLNDPNESLLATLHANADPPHEESPPPPVRRVVMVLIDGLGADAFEPLVDSGELGRLPDWRAYIDVGAPSLSRPVYHEILTGVPQAVSGIRTNAHVGRARADDLPERVRTAGGSVAWAMEGVTWFADLFAAPADARLQGAAVREERQVLELYDSGADFLVWHLIGTDVAGHAAGADSDRYRAEARDAVRLVRRVRDQTVSGSEGARTVWFIGADHGHLPRGGHGGPESAVRRTMWVGYWPGERTARTIVFPQYVPATRLAATFANVLGVDAPRETLGQPLPTPERNPPASPAIDRRERAVRTAFESAARSSRIAMSLRALFTLAVFVALGVRYARRERTHRVVTLPLAIVASAVLFYAIAGPGFTLSAIRTQIYFLVRASLSIVVGAAVAWQFARPRGARARDTFVVGVVPAIVSLVSSWASLGRASADPYMSLLAPTTGVLAAGIVGGVLIGELVRKLRKPPERSAPSSPTKLVPKKISGRVESSPSANVGGV